MQRKFLAKRRSDGDSGRWMSYNKVLIGNSAKRPHARNPNFDWEETKLLISLWGDPKVQRTLITTHKKYPVIAKIAEKMREHGYSRTPEEINTRIKNLKCFYNRIKKDLENGIVNTPSWKHYEDMDEILSRPIFGNNQRMATDAQSRSSLDTPPSVIEPEIKIKEENLTDEADDSIDSKDAKAALDAADAAAENGLAIPKDEPIDIDESAPGLESDLDDDFDDDFVESDEAQEPTPQKRPGPLSKTALPPASDVSRQVEFKVVEQPTRIVASSSAVVTSTPTSTAAVTAAVSAAATSAAAGKISLVPTNYLLKPQAQSILNQQLITQIQAQHHATPASSAPSTSRPMQLLLVNTLPKSVSGAVSAVTTRAPTITTPAISKQIPATTLPVRPKWKVVEPAPQPQPTQPAATPIPMPVPIQVTTTTPKVTQPPPPLPTQQQQQVQIQTPVQNGVASAPPKSSSTGLKSLLTELIKLQAENLSVQRQRLELDRERLTAERSMGQQIIEILTSLQRQRSVASAPSSAAVENASRNSTVAAAAASSASSSSVPYRLRREKRARRKESHDNVLTSTDDERTTKAGV